MTAKHNFAKLVTLVTNLVPQMFFLPLATTTCSLEHFFFYIFILTKCGAIPLFPHVGVCGPYTQL